MNAAVDRIADAYRAPADFAAAIAAAHATVRIEVQGRPVIYKVSLTRVGGGAA